MRKIRINALLLSACLSSAPIACMAVGLGNMHVQSALGQPLKARIDLIGTSPDELNSLTVTLASTQSYQQVNAPYSGALATLRMAIVSLPGSAPYVNVTSTSPITDPALDLLIKLSSPDGTLVHEYSLLLDPVGYNETTTDLPVINPQSIPQLSTAPVAPAKPIAAATGSSSAASMPLHESSAVALHPKLKPTVTKNVHVHKGDSLTAIVLRAEPKVINLDQALVAVYDANPGAFIGGNMNRLRSGVILRIPSEAVQQNVEPAKAMKEVAVQSRNWRIYRQKLAKAVISESGKKTHAGRYLKGTITAAENSPPATEKAHDVLKLSRGATPADKGIAGSNSSLKDKIEAMQENAIARQASLKEANERIAELEKTIKNMQALIAIKGQESAQQPVNTTAPKQVKPVVASNPQPVVSKKESSPVVLGKTPPSLRMRTLLYSIGALAVMVFALLLVYLRRRSRKFDEIEENERVAPTATTSLIPAPEFGIQDSIASHEIDPLAEAEVFIAHEHFDRAEEVLLEALEKSHAQEDLSYKLLEVYFLHKKPSEFLSLAKQYQDLHAESNPSAWKTISEWGSELLPDESLFSISQVGTANEDKKDELSLLDQFDSMGEKSEMEEPGETIDQQIEINEKDSQFDKIEGDSESLIKVEKTESEEVTADIDKVGIEPAVQPEKDELVINSPDVDQESIHEPPVETDSEVVVEISEPSEQEDSGLFVLDLPDSVTGNAPVSSEIENISQSSSHEFQHQDLQPIPASVGQDAVNSPTSKINLDYSFEGKGDDEQKSLEDVSADGLLTLPDFDFAGINLNLEPPPSGVGEKNSGFSDDVATRLDLAKAYLEMGDQEGAREILSEIQAEGDPGQQKEIADLIEKCQ